MLQAPNGGQVVGFVHHSLESAETLLWQRSHTPTAGLVCPCEYQGGAGDGGRRMLTEEGDREREVRFGLSGCQLVFR